MKIKAIRTRVFKPRENILSFLDDYIVRVNEKDIIVITSKIVALAEGRLIANASEDTKIKLIKSESEFCLQTKYVYLTIKDGVVMANAGIDESNANGNLILLPDDSFCAAAKIRKYFKEKYKLNNLGVIITDSRCLPLRAGIIGVALGYAGIKGLKDYRKRLDIFSRPFKYSRVNIADSLATAAVLCMGEGNEQQPLALISGAPVEYSNRTSRNELKIDIKDDIYKPMFEEVM